MAVLDRLRGAWNAFRSNDQEFVGYNLDVGPSSSIRQDRPRLRYYNERSIVTSIYTRMSVDIAGIGYQHIRVDDQGRYSNKMPTALNAALTLQPNIDQGPRAFRQDIASTLFDSGCAAIVPVDTDYNPEVKDVFDIYTLRVGEIVEWYPRHVRVSLYNEARGQRQEIILEKNYVAIVENPLFAVMNEPNSTLQRLLRKLTLLDAVDEQSSSGKLDLIIQLPYVIKSEARKAQADQRRIDIQEQLKGSQYGIAYTDGTEKITQLNRPAENNLLKQVEYLTAMLYAQLGITEDIMNGTADEKAMINYYNRSIKPVLDSVTEAMQRSFIGLSRTNQGERIQYMRDPFQLVPVSELAEIADKFTRNEILTSNEIRGVIGFPPANDPKADQLVNSNMPQQSISTDVASS